jgi:PLP dependent protein
MFDPAKRIAENLARVRERIAEAALASGRAADEVTLVAVTKFVGLVEIESLLAADCPDLGESRPQALWRKAEALAGRPIHWHMIGHLQRNKVRRTAPLVDLVHSADSRELVETLEACAAEGARRLPVLLEVNVSGEAAKHGFAPEAVESFLADLPRFGHLEVRGLMAMARLEGGRDAAQGDFARLRELRDRLRPLCPAGVSLDELSMGMSGDYDLAVREGATLVRVGSALFEGAGA